MPRNTSIKSVLIIGSGPIIIGQACEFDYAGSQASRSLREEGIEVTLINSNPATIMTDKVTADHIYLLPLNVISIEQILKEQKIDAVLPTMGGQTALNLCKEEVEGIIAALIKESGASSVKDMGRIMGLANKELAGKADGKLIAEIVKSQLA